MEQRIVRVDYYHTSVVDQSGEAYKFLSKLAELGINLLAFTAVPVGPGVTHLDARAIYQPEIHKPSK